MTVRVYTSLDSGAPTLQGVVGGAYSSGWTNGSLLELLRKVLVAGYGTTSPAGWALSYTGTSKGVFRQGAGCQFYLRVLDDGSLAGGAREASYYGGETATDVDTLGAQFPTSAQLANRCIVRKSNTADTTQRPWLCFADARTFWLFAWGNQGTSDSSMFLNAMHFGDFYSLHAADAFNCAVWGKTASQSTGNTLGNENVFGASGGASVGVVVNGLYVPRTYNQYSQSTQYAVPVPPLRNQTGSSTAACYGSDAVGNTAIVPFPNPSDHFFADRIYLLDPSAVPTIGLRGYFRGVWAYPHYSNHTLYGAVMEGDPNDSYMTGRTFQMLGLLARGGTPLVETSDTWDTN